MKRDYFMKNRKSEIIKEKDEERHVKITWKTPSFALFVIVYGIFSSLAFQMHNGTVFQG